MFTKLSHINISVYDCAPPHSSKTPSTCRTHALREGLFSPSDKDTALTRGKKLVVIGEPKALAMAVKNHKLHHRLTTLAGGISG
jgi:hypothetical protein